MESKKGAVLRELAVATDVAEMVKGYQFKPIVGVVFDVADPDHADDVANRLLTDVVNENAEALHEILQAKLDGRVAGLRAEYDALVNPTPAASEVVASEALKADAKVVPITKAKAKARRR